MLISLLVKEDINEVHKTILHIDHKIDHKTDHMDRKNDLAKLPIASGASYDSYLNQHEEECLPETRTELLHQIMTWSEDEQGKSIFWLNGMAGTWKSTIARTVAKTLAQTRLGGSFFFKRGEGDRGNATRFFTTLAIQLTVQVRPLIPYIASAVEADPAISTKSLKEQFEKLLLQPLSQLQLQDRPASTMVIVIDALDECEREEDIRIILRLLPCVKQSSIVRFRVLVTSRPELPIRLGFKQISEDDHQDLVLHEIPKETIERDISLYFKRKFAQISQARSLPREWPGEENIQILVSMAVPLFIFAATVCRFVGDLRWDPENRLATILTNQTSSHLSKLDQTYIPILNQLLTDQDERESEELKREFREIVGAIIILASPLSIISLARLLDRPERVISCRLDSFHSVLSIPSTLDVPVRLLHLSFRDFLLDPNKSRSPFWVNEVETHQRLAARCLAVMRRGLGKNICHLPSYGTARSEIDDQAINDHLPMEIQYACRYWMYHLQQGKFEIRDHDSIHSFLREHLLHWLEAMSILGMISESINSVDALHSLVQVSCYG
jgi:hypothetical protein